MTIRSIYLYKITFEEIPHFYWGIHLNRVLEDTYMGSPCTFSELWEIYTPIKQIFFYFEPTEEGWETARETEEKVIRSTWDTPLSLNRNAGGSFSLIQQRENAQAALKKNGDNHGTRNPEILQKCLETQEKNGTRFFTPEQCDRGRETQKEQGLGYFDPEKRLLGLNTQREQGTGLFDTERKRERIQRDSELGEGLYSPENNQKRSESAQRINSQVWECLHSGHRSNPGGLSKFQNARDIDTSLRRRIS